MRRSTEIALFLSYILEQCSKYLAGGQESHLSVPVFVGHSVIGEGGEGAGGILP